MKQKLTICSIVGARPQFIKLQPFSEKLRQYHNEIIIHTGQHYDANMSKTFFSELNIPQPDFNLDVRSPLHGEQTGRMLILIEELLMTIKPAAVVIFGDTNSTLAGALAAVKLHIPTFHIEAGLRSFNRRMPEEINRIAADHISDYLYAPTPAAMENLKKEGLASRSIITGDIMVDSLKNAIGKMKDLPPPPIFSELNLTHGKSYLLTLHRPQNVDDPEKLFFILSKLNKLDHKVVFPIHPRTRKVLAESKFDSDRLENIHLINPQSYLSFVFFQQNAAKILTDSGGIQKEAYILQKPCITIRSETEWTETVDSGWNILCEPFDEDFIDRIIGHRAPSDYADLFGRDVADKIVASINEIL